MCTLVHRSTLLLNCTNMQGGRAVLCCAVLCCAVLCCAVLCCAVLRCAALRCASEFHAMKKQQTDLPTALRQYTG